MDKQKRKPSTSQKRVFDNSELVFVGLICVTTAIIVAIIIAGIVLQNWSGG